MNAPGLTQNLAFEMGSLSARATLQEPDVRLEFTDDGTTVLRIEEGGVRLDLEFADLGCVERFYRRIRSRAFSAAARH